MSFCAVSCCTCSPRVSFVSVTSASWPTGDAPDYCRYASQHWALFPHRSKQKPLPPRNPTLFGAAPSAADRWRSLNDLPLLNSNSDLHHRWSPLQHETARPQLENSARFPARRPRSVLLLIRPLLRSLFHTIFDHRFLRPHLRRPLPPLPCTLPPTSTPLLGSIQFAYGPRQSHRSLPH